MDGDRPIVIIGAGVAGLTLALALARHGRRSVILERADQLAVVGAGIQLSPNASRVLVGLGLEAALGRVAVEPDGIVIRSLAARGAPVARLPLRPGMRERYGAPFLVIHRGDLQATLLAAVRAEPLVGLHTGVMLQQARDGEVVEVEAVAGGEPLGFRADALIGADGVRSWVRGAVLGGPPSRFSGRIAWRATFPAAKWSGEADILRSTGLWLGRGAHLVHYPVRSGSEINLVAIAGGEEAGDGWDAAEGAGEVLRRFEGWPPLARALLEMPEGWRRWSLHGVPAGGAWARGRVALVGDAAHAMLPFVAQGGAMAIEDAAVLARLIGSAGSIPVALREYERLRRPRVAAVAEAARRNGTVYHLSGVAALARDAAMRAMGNRRLLERMDWIYGWRDEA